MRIGILLLFASIYGCTALPPDPMEAAPTCEAGHECSAKWFAAETWITDKAHRTIVQKTDDFMRTGSNLSRGNHLAISVQRVRIAPGEYRIEARMRCGSLSGCNPTPAEAVQQFNRYVNESWIELPRKPD